MFGSGRFPRFFLFPRFGLDLDKTLASQRCLPRVLTRRESSSLAVTTTPRRGAHRTYVLLFLNLNLVHLYILGTRVQGARQKAAHNSMALTRLDLELSPRSLDASSTTPFFQTGVYMYHPLGSPWVYSCFSRCLTNKAMLVLRDELNLL